jgi:hypothetical protein
MDYKRHYNLLIERARLRNRSDGTYYESHHILPRCMGGSDDEDNLVLLTPEEHYIAHLILVRMYPESKSLSHAAAMMCVGKKRTDNKLYGWLRRRMADAMRGDNNPMRTHPEKNPFNKKGAEHPAYGRMTSDNTRSILRQTKLGDKNPLYKVHPWMHPRSKPNRHMWQRADEYYTWWVQSGLDHGQNAMAKAFNEPYRMTHTNLVKRFRNGWVPQNDEEWMGWKDKI